MKKLTKREWIKNIAIVFLVIMLILTFFSNTIMNRTLPEVSTQNVTNGTIQTQVRGDGIVEAEDPYNVEVDETRKIKSVAVKVGDKVEIGDVIYYLAGESSEELTTAKNDLSALHNDYDMFLIEKNITLAEAEKIQGGVTTSTTTILHTLEEKDKEITEVQKAVDDYTKKKKDLENQQTLSQYDKVDTSAEEAALDKAKEESKAADSLLAKYDDLKEDYVEKSDAYNVANAEFVVIEEQYNSTDPSDPAYESIKEEYLAAKRANASAWTELSNAAAKLPTDEQYAAAKADADSKKQRVAEAQKNLDNKSATLDNNSESLKKQIDEINIALEEKNEKLDNLNKARQEYIDTEKDKIDLEKKYQEILKKEKSVKDLEDKALGGEITAPVAGTIASLKYTAGEKTEAGVSCAVIQIEGKGYTLSFSVNDRQAKSVKVGDEVSVVNNWFYGEITANLIAIKPDKENPKNGKILMFSISGEDIQEGQNLTLSVGQKSSNYDFIVPLSALKEDNNGTFILIVETKSTPFGSRYIAKRVEVEVLEKDDKNAAVKAELFGYEYVITTSSKPLENGDQVKLAE